MRYTGDVLIGKLEGIAAEVVSMSAISCFDFIGKQDPNGADDSAVQMARLVLNNSLIDGTVRIGEGERDHAPLLYTGETVGKGSDKIDIAIDPLEGTDLCANNKGGAMTTITLALDGGIFSSPDIYMDKIATCKKVPTNLLNLDYTVEKNLSNLSDHLGKNIKDLRVCLLDRERNLAKINSIIGMGISPVLIDDGDIAAIIKTSEISDDFDIYLGIGGAPEGVIASSFVNATEGFMECRFVALNEHQLLRAKSMSTDLERKFNSSELVSRDSIFSAAILTESVISGSHGLKKDSGLFKVSIILANSAIKDVKITEKLMNPQVAIATKSTARKKPARLG